MNLQRLINTIRIFLSSFFADLPNASTSEILGLFGATWFLIIFGWFAIRQFFHFEVEPFAVDYIILFASFIIGGSGGFVVIVRREFPPFSRTVAVLLGWFLLLSAWGLAFYAFWLLIA